MGEALWQEALEVLSLDFPHASIAACVYMQELVLKIIKQHAQKWANKKDK